MSQRSIYFIQAGLCGPIKIGITNDVTKRLLALQTGHHEDLHVICEYPGTLADERQLHGWFEHYRIRGEWFHHKPEILAYIGAEG